MPDRCCGSCPKYLSGVLKMVFILSGPVLLYLLADSFDKHSRERYPLPSILVTLAVLAVGFLLVFAPHLVANNVWMPPRSIFSFFALFTFMAVVTGYNYVRNGKSVSLAVPVVLLVLLTANIMVIQGIALDQVNVNRLDKAEAEEIVRHIREYEAENGQTVDTIGWRTESKEPEPYRLHRLLCRAQVPFGSDAGGGLGRPFSRTGVGLLRARGTNLV